MRYYIVDRDMYVFTTDNEERANSFADSDDHVVIDTQKNVHIHDADEHEISSKGEFTESERIEQQVEEDGV
jgi:phage anti-repressor protein